MRKQNAHTQSILTGMLKEDFAGIPLTVAHQLRFRGVKFLDKSRTHWKMIVFQPSVTPLPGMTKVRNIHSYIFLSS